MKLLFVCTGNSCRSVMAEFLLNHEARERGLEGWEARSAGVAAERDFPTPSGVVKALARKGIGPVQHTPQLATRELLRWADLVLVMSKGHLRHLQDEYPEFYAKIRLFLEYALGQEKDVEDPIGRPDAVYADCLSLLERGVDKILDSRG